MLISRRRCRRLSAGLTRCFRMADTTHTRRRHCHGKIQKRARKTPAGKSAGLGDKLSVQSHPRDQRTTGVAHFRTPVNSNYEYLRNFFLSSPRDQAGEDYVMRKLRPFGESVAMGREVESEVCIGVGCWEVAATGHESIGRPPEVAYSSGMPRRSLDAPRARWVMLRSVPCNRLGIVGSPVRSFWGNEPAGAGSVCT
jgi:hypothetical protein